MMEEKEFIIRISHSETSGNFFADLCTKDNGAIEYIVSIWLNEHQATGIAKDLGLKIMNR
jgi:hypothetical protein